jgi:hypothetical protein
VPCQFVPLGRVVALPDGMRAVDCLQQALSRADNEYEDLGRVNDTLVEMLNLTAGEFARI